ncbi:MAG: hypothetical protein ABI758_02120 [Candidatus Woesebacteria bacterium]
MKELTGYSEITHSRKDSLLDVSRWLELKSVYIRSLLSRLPVSSPLPTEMGLEVYALFADEPTLFGRSSLPFFSKNAQKEWENFEVELPRGGVVKIHTLSVEQLKTVLSDLRIQTDEEQKQVHGELLYLRKNAFSESKKTEKVRNVQIQVQEQLSYIPEIRALLTENEIKSETVRAWVSSILKLHDALASVTTQEQAKNIVTLWNSCTLSLDGEVLLLHDVVGAESLALIGSLNGKSMRDVQSICSQVLGTLSKSSLFTSILHLDMTAGNPEFSGRRKESLQDFDGEFFQATDVYHQIDATILELRARFPTQIEFQKAIATFLFSLVSQGKLAPALAREIHADVRTGNTESHSLSTAFLDSYMDFIQGYPETEIQKGQTSTEKTGKKTRKLPKKVILALLAVALASQIPNAPEIVKKTLDLVRQSASTISHLPDMVSTISSLNLSGSVESGSESTQGGEEVSSLSQSSLTEILERKAEDAKDKVLKPLTDADLTHPAQDGLAGDFVPGSVSIEGYPQMAASVLWEMPSAWEVQPDFFITNTYTSINMVSGGFRHFQPTTEMKGTVLPPVNPSSDTALPNELIGKRDMVSDAWMEVPVTTDMVPTSGSVLVYSTDDNTFIGQYPIELLTSPSGPEMYARALLGPEDKDWLAQNKNHISVQLDYSYGRRQVLSIPKEGINDQEDLAPFEILPVDLQNLITSLNSDTSKTDQEKLVSVQHWFNSFGSYSFNSKDDQWLYVNNAIANNVIDSSQRVEAFYGLFYGTFQDDLGLPPNTPSVGAGECNRRNGAAQLAFSYLQLQSHWSVVLESGNVVGGIYSSDTNLIRGNTAHMRTVAYGPNGEKLNLDVTSAPRTDELTGKELAAFNSIGAGVADANSTSTEISAPNEHRPIIDWVYEPSPEVLKYPSVFQETEIPLERVSSQPIPDSYGNYLENEYPLLQPLRDYWKVKNVEAVPPFVGYTEEDFSVPVGFISLEANGTAHTTLGTRVNPSGDFMPKLGEFWTTSSYDMFVPDGTNMLPVFNIQQYSSILLSSIHVQTKEGIDLPFRVEKYQSDRHQREFTRYLVLDLPAEQVGGKTYHVSFQSGAYPRDMNLVKSSFYPESLENPIFPYETVKERLAKYNFSENLIERLYFEYYTLVRLHRSAEFTPEIVKNIQEMTSDQKLLDIADAFVQLDTIARNAPLEKIPVFIDSMDQKFPDMMQEIYLLYPYDHILETPELKPLHVRLKNGERVTIREYLEARSQGNFEDDPYGALSDFNNLLDDYTTKKLNTILPFEDRAFGNENYSQEDGTYKYCMATEKDEGIIQCFLRAPYKNQIMIAWMRNIVYKAFSDQSALNTIELDENGKTYLGIDTREYDLSFFSNDYENWGDITGKGVDPTNEYARLRLMVELQNKAANENNGETKFVITDEIMQNLEDQFAIEQSATYSWYVQEAIAKGIQLTIPLSIVLYLGMRGIAQRRRWSRYKSRGNTEELVDRLGSELLLDGKTKDWVRGMLQNPRSVARLLDQSWKNSEEGLTTIQGRVQREALVQGLHSRGEKSFPFGSLRGEKADNPWNSREVPPTYSILTRDISQTGVLSDYASLLTEAQSMAMKQSVESLLQTTLEQGLSGSVDGQSIRSFRSNELVIGDISAFEVRIEADLYANLTSLGIKGIDRALLREFSHEVVSPVWQKTMADWKTMNSHSGIFSKRH